VPLRRRQIEKIDLLAALAIFQNRRAVDRLRVEAGGIAFDLVLFTCEAPDQLLVVGDIASSQRHTQPLGVGDRARQYPETFAITRYIVEQQRRSSALAVDFTDDADFQIGTRSADARELP